MGRMNTYLIMMCGITFVFYLAGLVETGTTIRLLELMLNPSNLPFTSFSSIALAALEGAAAAGLSIGFLATGRGDLALASPIAVFLFDLGWSFFSVFNKFTSYGAAGYVLGTAIFAPLLVLWIVALVDWWRGMSTS